MLFRVLPLLVKPVVWVALYETVDRLALLTGVRLVLIEPIADAIAAITGVNPRYADFALVALITASLFETGAAVCNFVGTSLNSKR
ncbi:MAG: hypothetical protein LAQ30_12945 [Acidobacteriia bacterium]|nr:hypothetical protein [Terriglobia bacterium]